MKFHFNMINITVLILGNDLPKSPDLKRSPISTKETSTQNRGPGPKIRMRDGSKVLVTELLRSREGMLKDIN